jgi:glucosamine--fructose-6-phosphate aminotransferase (isomerizing)
VTAASTSARPVAIEAPGGGMAKELAEAPAAVRAQAQEITQPLAALVTRLAQRPPQVVVTCARGSSAHAATFAKHLIERHLGIPVAAAAPNVASVYHRRLALKDQLFLAISQSGSSDDLIEMAATARGADAVTAAIVNDANSPLAQACEFVLPMGAGPELSVAATKTFIASLAASLRLVARWSADERMAKACERLPERLAQAAQLDWSEALAPLTAATALVAVGRGPTLAIAREAALKLQETCTVHAQAFSSAEFRHGPLALASATLPVLMLTPTDASAMGFSDLAADLRRAGAQVLIAGDEVDASLPTLPPEQADADAICLIQSFYALLPHLAERRGVNVDRPRHLQKVTRTR